MEHTVLNVPERNFELLVPPRMLFGMRHYTDRKLLLISLANTLMTGWLNQMTIIPGQQASDL